MLNSVSVVNFFVVVWQIGTAESLPLTVEIAECDASPRCRMEKMALDSKGDMMAIMKVG